MTTRSLRTHMFVGSAVFLLALSAVPESSAYEVRMTGSLDEELAEVLRGGSLLVENADREEPIDVHDIVSSAQADYRRLLAVLYDEGYFGPSIEIKLDGQEASDILAVSPPDRISSAIITIDPGRQFRFGVVDVSPLPPDTKLPASLETGETARVSLLKSAANVGVSAWRDTGHAKAAVSGQQITANHQSATIDAQVALDPGPRLRFGALNVENDSAVRRERILEIAGLPEGEVFSPGTLDDAAARLRRTGAFRSVAVIEGEVEPSSDILPVDLRVVDNKPRRFGFGADLETIEGLTIRGFWMHRNMFGGAERLRFDAEIGGLGGDTGGTDYLLRTSFLRPATFGADTDFYAIVEAEREDEPNYFAKHFSLESGIERTVNDNISYRLGLGLRTAETEDAFGDNDYTLLLVPTSTTFEYRNNELDARRGYYADVELTPFVAVNGADNGLLTELDLRTYKTFGTATPTTLALRAQLGSVVGPGLESAPADFLFYSGGGGTVRGQEYQSLGVRIGDDDDDIVGGRSFLGLSAELRMRTSGTLGYVGFVDAGYIGRESFPDGSGEWQSGAGVGLRYATPIGPLRVDIAFPTSSGDSNDDFQLYFGIGHSF